METPSIQWMAMPGQSLKMNAGTSLLIILLHSESGRLYVRISKPIDDLKRSDESARASSRVAGANVVISHVERIDEGVDSVEGREAPLSNRTVLPGRSRVVAQRQGPVAEATLKSEAVPDANHGGYFYEPRKADAVIG